MYRPRTEEVSIPNNWVPRSYQLPVWKYLENGGRHVELFWHRRSGKDDLALHWAATAAFTRVADYWHMLPQASQARKAVWDSVNPHTGRRRIDEAFPRQLRRSVRKHDMHIEFINGSTWQVVGSDNYNSLVGSTPAGIVYSEWALANPEARAYLRPILAENNGWQIFITTPRGRNHAASTMKAAQSDPSCFAQILDATQTDVFTPEQLDAELRAYQRDFGHEYGTAKFEQEFLCSLDAQNLGSILSAALTRAEKTGRISNDIEFDPNGSPIEITADIGHRDTACWYFWQPTLGGFHVFDHDSGWGLDADEWIERIKLKLAPYGPHRLGTIWLPHDAKARTFAAKRTAMEAFINAFGHKKISIVPGTRRADRVNAARVMIQQCAFNASKCEKGIEALRSWSYEYDEKRRMFSSEPFHDWASHDGDAFSYGCVVMQREKHKTRAAAPTFYLEQRSDQIFWPDQDGPTPSNGRI